MTSTTTALCAVGCGAPCVDAYICKDCTAKLVRDLEDIATGLLDELETSYLRQARFGAGGGGSRSAETSLPWDDRASTVASSVTVLIERWAWKIASASCAPSWPRDGAVPAAAFLLQRIEWIRHNTEGVAAWRSLHAGIGRVLHVVDRPAAAWYAGPCWSPPLEAGDCPCACHVDDGARVRPACSVEAGCHPNHRDGVAEQLCGAPLYARPKASTVTCRVCRTDWLVDKLRGHLMTASQDWLATATEIARAVTLLGEHVVTPERIRQWKARGRLEVRGYVNDDDETGPRYRIGDVIDLLSEDTAAQARRAAKRDQREKAAS